MPEAPEEQGHDRREHEQAEMNQGIHWPWSSPAAYVRAAEMTVTTGRRKTPSRTPTATSQPLIGVSGLPGEAVVVGGPGRVVRGEAVAAQRTSSHPCTCRTAPAAPATRRTPR